MFDTTRDKICRGLLTLTQPRKGYRFNIDAILLARFAAERRHGHPPSHVVDLGAGCGIVGLLAGKIWTDTRVHLVEIQSELSQLCRENAEQNWLADRATVHQGDLRAWIKTASQHIAMQDQVTSIALSNPPFFPAGQGQRSPNLQIATARHELNGSLHEWIDQLTQHSGIPEFYVILPADRFETLSSQLCTVSATISSYRHVHPFAEAPANRVLLQISLASSHTRAAQSIALAPLIMFDAPGQYTAALNTMLGDAP